VFPDPTVLDQVQGWVRDPFLVIYRYHSVGVDSAPHHRLPHRRNGDGAGGDSNPTGEYALIGIGCFDWRSRTMKVIDPYAYTGTPIYDTYDYPARSWDPKKAADIAFNVDWVNGTMRSDFPPYHAELLPPRTADQPVVVEGKDLKLRQLQPNGPVDYPLPLANPEWWETRAGSTALYYFLLPDSVSVRVDSTGDGRPDRALQRVHRTPRDYSDEFQVGLDPGAGDGDPAQPKYGYIRLPAHLSLWDQEEDQDGKPTRVWTATKDVAKFWIYYRWRNNGVVPATAQDEKPDLVSAYYRTASVLDINLTVARIGPRGAQAAHMTRRVKLQNVIREIREGK